jgi:hypothetical protein
MNRLIWVKIPIPVTRLVQWHPKTRDETREILQLKKISLVNLLWPVRLQKPQSLKILQTLQTLAIQKRAREKRVPILLSQTTRLVVGIVVVGGGAAFVGVLLIQK